MVVRATGVVAGGGVEATTGAETVSKMAEALTVTLVATVAALVVRRSDQSGPGEADSTYH